MEPYFYYTATMHHNLLKCIHVTPTALSSLKKMCFIYNDWNKHRHNITTFQVTIKSKHSVHKTGASKQTLSS